MRSEKGSVSLEALLSLMFMLVVIGVTWGVCVFIFNMSVMNTSTQFASQAALLTYDRSTYRGIDVKGYHGKAVARAETVAWEVFKENSCNTLADPVTSKKPETGCDGSPLGGGSFGVSFVCGPAEIYDQGGVTPREDYCRTGHTRYSAALEVKAVSRMIQIPFSIGFDSPRSTIIPTEATSYSYVRPS